MKISHILPAALVLTASTFAMAAPASAEKPVVVKRVVPDYPAVAVRRDVAGKVEVVFDIEKDGDVTNIRVSEDADETLNAAAADAIAQWKFEEGAPDEDIRVIVDFQL